MTETRTLRKTSSLADWRVWKQEPTMADNRESPGFSRVGAVKYAVATLEGVLLDAAVAKAEGFPFVVERHMTNPTRPIACWLKQGDRPVFEAGPFTPSTDWYFGGPRIERARIELQCFSDGSWGANCWPSGPEDGNEIWSGPKPLIAGMRAFVASRFGDEVELP